jgi:hypothetical protein
LGLPLYSLVDECSPDQGSLRPLQRVTSLCTQKHDETGDQSGIGRGCASAGNIAGGTSRNGQNPATVVHAMVNAGLRRSRKPNSTRQHSGFIHFLITPLNRPLPAALSTNHHQKLRHFNHPEGGRLCDLAMLLWEDVLAEERREGGREERRGKIHFGQLETVGRTVRIEWLGRANGNAYHPLIWHEVPEGET